jgi:hypothetical protein
MDTERSGHLGRRIEVRRALMCTIVRPVMCG